MNYSITVLLVITLATTSCRGFAPIQTLQSLQQLSSSSSLTFQDEKDLIKRNGQQLLMIGNFFNFDKKNEKDEEDVEVTNSEATKDSTKSSEYVESDDPVEKLFNFFFGEKEETPMGLARFGANRFPGMSLVAFSFL
jgi:hypothetical protein